MSELTPQKAFESKTGEDAYGNDLWGTAGVNPSYVQFLEDEWSTHDKLKERFKKYARHQNDEHGMCKLLIHSKYGCTCGLDELMSEEIEGDEYE